MNAMYEVLWIDDEWDKMTSFKEECEVIHHIRLHPFRTQKAGMEALDKTLKKWDAILLDARMLDQSEENEVAKLDGLRKAIAHINQLATRRAIPYFIFTGQPDLMSNELFEESFGKFYNKGKDGAQLVADIKSAVSKSERFQIKAFYPNAVETLSLLNQEDIENILDILEAMHFPSSHPDFKPSLYYNPLRKALENVFRLAGKAGIIPEDFFQGGLVNINQCFMFLIGNSAEKIGYKAAKRIAPRHIQNMMSLVINLGNVSSHSVELSHDTMLSDSEIQKYEDYNNRINVDSRILLFSMALQFCQIVKWMSKYVDDHPDKEENLKNCVKLESDNEDRKEITEEKELIGYIEEHNGICHMGKRFSVLLKDKNLLGKKIRVVNYLPNNNAKTKQYPFFVREQDFELIEDMENSSK